MGFVGVVLALILALIVIALFLTLVGRYRRCPSNKILVIYGKTGKGGGPSAQELSMKVPDLTTYAKRNGGAFPTELAWQKIDGRPAKFDMTRQMPVWGSDFRHEAMAGVKPAAAPESYVAAEIAAMLEYLKSIQVK